MLLDDNKKMRLQRLFMVACLLIGVFISILYLYGSSWNVEVLRTPQDLASWLQQPVPPSSKGDSDAESQKEAEVYDSTQGEKGSTPVVSGLSSSTTDSDKESGKSVDVSINQAEANGEETMAIKPASPSSTADLGPESRKKPNVSTNKTEADAKGTAPFIAWMVSIGITSERVPLITIADSKYTHALRNLKARLDKWDRGSDLVVICLDRVCADEDSFAGYRGYIDSSEDPMKHVALIKFEVNLELAQNGYSFVFLDGDVYLTGSRDPFEDMLPLSNDTWDIQFQSDQKTEPTTRVNIGWYFAKSTPATIEFFERSYKNWTAENRWDQTVMNEIVELMEAKEHKLTVHRLWSPHFQNWMSINWEPQLFGNEPTAAAFIKGASMIHYTCVEQSLKTYLGLNFGGFADIDNYYSSSPPLLAVANVSGLLESVHAQVAFAAQLAVATNRTLIWPDSVNLVQKRVNFEGSSVGYTHLPRFPGVRLISYASAQQAGVKTVEGRYISNQKAQNKAIELRETLIDASKTVLEGGATALESYVSGLEHTDVAVLDFANFAHGTWMRKFVESGMDLNNRYDDLAYLSNDVEEEFQESYAKAGLREYSAPLLKSLRKCLNANNKWSGCLQICE